MANTERISYDTGPNSAARRPSSIASVDSRRSSTRSSLDSTGSAQAFSTLKPPFTDKASHARACYDGQSDDRVFPVRSVVSVDPSQTPFSSPSGLRGESGQDFPDLSAALVGSALDWNQTSRQDPSTESAVDTEPSSTSVSRPSTAGSELQALKTSASFPVTQKNAVNILGFHEKNNRNEQRQAKLPDMNPTQLFCSDASTTTSKASTNYNGSHSVLATDSSEENFPITARFKHITTDGGHAIITGRDGDVLQQCEDEPIHIPGAVQSFGLLVALEEKHEGQLSVRVVSENSRKIIGYGTSELFALPSFTDILSEEQTDNLLDHIDFIRDEDADVASNGPEVFTLSIRQPGRRRTIKLWCAMHVNPDAPDIIICEFELDDDEENPLAPQSFSADPEDTLHSSPTEEEFVESTVAASKPLRVLRSARRRKGEAAAMEVFNILSQLQEQLAAASDLESFLKILCGIVKELTGFHRVMIYQFDSTFNGRVVAELVDPRATKDLYKGLHFPASDIPKQARELYKINKVRLLYDRELPTARLVCRTKEDLETPLDLTYSYLRAMSPIHIKYLANMAVRSSMSISINAFGELWGLIALHGYGSKGMRVSFPIRKMCRLVGDTASWNIERLSYASRLQGRKLINTMPSDSNPSGYIVATSDDLLKLFDADFGCLSIHDETKILGQPESSQELLAMVEYLRIRKYAVVITSDNIKNDFPDAPNKYIKVIAGLLLVPLSVDYGDFIVFFRRGQTKEVKWAGNPYEKFAAEGREGYLEPRKSFKTWTEVVVGKCREWTENQVETAAVLCLVYGKFVQVWRQKEAALQSSKLTRLLLANQAHEVRTPLNAIINYLEIAMEGTLDQETRDSLAKSHSASKSLIYVINDLLDLTKTEEGQILVETDIFDLPATVTEATDFFKNDAKRKSLEYEVVQHPGVPQFVYGDQRRVRQAVSNITANAIQHTTTGSVRVDFFVAERVEKGVLIEIAVEDTGCGMSEKKLDALFRDLEQVSTEDLFPKNDEDKESRTLGLGLATVARTVRNCGGTLRVKSEVGEGTRMACQLPFDNPDAPSRLSSPLLAELPTSMDTALTPHEGEVMLIDRPLSLKGDGRGRPSVHEDNTSIRSRMSNLSHYSIKSGSSGAMSHASARSDVDRLIDAISEPNPVGRGQHPSPHYRGSFSGGKGSRASVDVKGSALASSPRQERPSSPWRGASYASGSSIPEHVRSASAGQSGTRVIQDNKTLLKAIRIPEDYSFDETEQPPQPPNLGNQVMLEVKPVEEPSPDDLSKLTAAGLKVLVAEDDPINTRILVKRLEKLGHSCTATVNGEECATAYCENPAQFDVVLMDMQMPLVDGLTSTKMIRSHALSHPEVQLSARATLNARTPIFAVSASLVEREAQTYISAGFDGWILKPIDFKRLNVLLTGIVEEDVRNSCLYKPGEWERGGWFGKREQRGDEDSTHKPKVTSNMRLGSDDGEEEEKKTIEIHDFAEAGTSLGAGSGKSRSSEEDTETLKTRLLKQASVDRSVFGKERGS